MPNPAPVSGPSVEAPWRLADGALLLGVRDGRGNGDRHCLGDIVLQHENIGEIAIVPLCPYVLASLGLDQLRGKPDPIASCANTAFEHVAHAELTPDLPHVHSPAFILNPAVG